MGLVYRALVRGAGSDLAFGISHPMDDGNLIYYNRLVINFARNA
jgi:hypothetical protein